MFSDGDGFGGGSDAGDGAGEESAATPAASRSRCTGRCRGGNDDGGRSLVGSGRAAAAPAGGFIGEGEGNFDLGVFGEGFGAWQVDGAARTIDAVGRRTGAKRIAGAVAI